MSRVDWAAMSPREVWEALSVAPRVAGHWETFGGVVAHRLEPARGGGCAEAAFVGRTTNGLWAWRVERTEMGCAESLEEAKAAADAELTRRGWLLVDDENPSSEGKT